MSTPGLQGPAEAAGITLLELLLAVALLALLATLGIPSFQRQLASSRLSAAANDLGSALALARSQAIQKGVRFTVCRSLDQSECDTGARDWSTGWIVFQDDNGNRTREASEAITLVAHALPADITARGNAPVASNVSFRPSGEALQAGTLRVCSSAAALGDSHRTSDLILTNSGRVVTVRSSPVLSTCPNPT
ncbi:GspH/FimT family protein [Ramlibacter sp. AN1015]|uniref:GspH/FimT family protein n=1 Tax=Ramlibacter sp. AN1015 TaxID=3133428 RepID=UPI0030C3145E